MFQEVAVRVGLAYAGEGNTGRDFARGRIENRLRARSVGDDRAVDEMSTGFEILCCTHCQATVGMTS